MHTLRGKDGDLIADWGKTSEDYSAYRPAPPESFFEKLKALQIGMPEQQILDLGTGTGMLARQFAVQGSRVSGIDIAENQIDTARQLAQEQGLTIDFQLSAAESLPFEDRTFDVVTANQCWLYFDKELTIPEVNRVLKDNGVLVTSHFSWLPRIDPVARATEALILKHNPKWSASDWDGVVPDLPEWARGQYEVVECFVYDEAISFTRESWRGRARACRGVGATLTSEKVEAFDIEHEALLREIAPEVFTILHRLDAHVFRPIR